MQSNGMRTIEQRNSNNFWLFALGNWIHCMSMSSISITCSLQIEMDHLCRSDMIQLILFLA
jgi:hypothetical protein